MRVQALSRRMEQLLEAADVREDMTEQYMLVMVDMTELYMLVMVAMEGQLERLKPLEDLKCTSHGHVAPVTLAALANSHHSSRPR